MNVLEKNDPPAPAARPRTGVLINNYNNGPWLRACVDSVLAQTHPADEIIVYDDGSTDDSLAVLRSYGGRIRVVEGRHDDTRTGIASQAHAVHRAFVLSSAEHLYLLDGDDVFLPQKIERYEQAWSARPEAVLVQASTCLIDSNGRVLGDGYEMLKHPPDGDFVAATYRTQDTDLYYSTSALAFARSLLARMLPLDYSDGIALAVDNRLGAVAPFFGPVISLDENLTCWRQHGGSQSHQGSQRSPLEGTLRRNRYFNACAQRFQLRPLHLWRNPRFHRQVLRRCLPGWVSAPFARNPAGVRPKT